MLIYAIITIVGYFISTFLIWFFGVSVFGGVGTFDEIRRSIGYAYSPYLFAGVPCVGILASFWALAAFYVATRQTLDISSGKTVIIIIIAGIGQFILYGVVATAIIAMSF